MVGTTLSERLAGRLSLRGRVWRSSCAIRDYRWRLRWPQGTLFLVGSQFHPTVIAMAENACASAGKEDIWPLLLGCARGE
jgi:hypothetical protein